MDNEERISGGYYIKARKIQESWIAHAPPHVREIWDWLLLNANYVDKKVSDGKIIKRGQCLCSYDDIREGLHWMVGWRKEKYSKWDCEKAMKVLTKATMIATTKTTRGMIVTILNYDKYQNPENYESHNEGHRKATRKPQTADTISKEREEYEERKKKETTPARSENDRSKPAPPEIRLNLETFYWENITDADMDRWRAAYPACEIGTELYKAAEWIRANPTKVKKNWLRFITNWLSRAQDHGGTKMSSRAGNDKPKWVIEFEKEQANGRLPV